MNAAFLRIGLSACDVGAIDAPSLEVAVAMEDRNQIVAAQTGDFREGEEPH